MLRHGWRTGAIIPELEREIRIINTEQYMHSLTWQQALTGLLERMQVWGRRAAPGGGQGCRPGTHPAPTSSPPDVPGRRVAAGAGCLDEGAAGAEVGRVGQEGLPASFLLCLL